MLTADLGPAERYRRWLAVRRGAVRVVVGTRSAAFAPVAAPGLLAVWDDGDDLHAEPRAPYPHVRDVLVLRAHAVGAALLVAGYARTAEGQLLVESGWASEIVADRATVRAAMPRVVAQGESDLQLARDPWPAPPGSPPRRSRRPAPPSPPAGRCWSRRRGRATCRGCPARSCRETARCRHCAGPLGLPAEGPTPARPPRAGRPRSRRAIARRRPRSNPADRRRGAGGRRGVDRTADPTAAAAPPADGAAASRAAYRCGACGSRRLRAGVVGSRRTAEELGPRVPRRRRSALRRRRAGAGHRRGPPDIVVATPGAEPPRGRVRCRAAARRVGPARPAGPAGRRGDAAPVDGGGRAGRAAHRRRAGAGRGRRRPGVATGAGTRPVGSGGHAAAELAARTEVGFPPAVRMAAMEGAAPPWPRSSTPCSATRLQAGRGPDVDVLGPVELDPEPGADPAAPRRGRERALVRVPRAQGRALAAALAAEAAQRSARKATDPVRVRWIRPRSADRPPGRGARPRRGGTSGHRRGRIGSSLPHHLAGGDTRCPTTRVHRPPGSRPRSGIRGRPESKEIRDRPARPALRRSGAAHPRRGGDDLRRRAAPAGRGPDRHDARGARCRPRRPAARRRVCGCSPTTAAGSPGTWSTRPSSRSATRSSSARRAACRSPSCPGTAAGT